MHMDIISIAEAKQLNPLLEEKYFVGALYDPDEGSVDPYGVTHAYAICARNRGAEVYTDTWVTGARRSAPTARGTSSPIATTPSTPSTSSTPAVCGRARSVAWSGSSCRCWRWSTTT